MSKINDKTYATSDVIIRWESIDFAKAENHVKKLQRRIAKAYTNRENDKVAFLQHTLIHSFFAKSLAVKSVTSNKGKYTYGTDNKLYVTPEEKMKLVFELSRRTYKSKPLRRISIPKPDGSKRPLSIPTIKDRAMQTLYKFALEPIAEVTADVHSYGFKNGYSTQDAIARCIEIFYDKPNCRWILKADIKSCFDNISHEWILNHIPIDKTILKNFLKSGYIHNGNIYTTERGLPQGGCISTVICNMVLDGLENKITEQYNDIHYIRYADDIIVIAADKALLENPIKHLISEFLEERGLQLSVEKTSIVSIEDGCDFLGWNIRKDKQSVLVKPSIDNSFKMINNVRQAILNNTMASTDELYRMLAPKIIGWINYHKNIVRHQSLGGAEYYLLDLILQLTSNERLVFLVMSLFENSIKKSL